MKIDHHSFEEGEAFARHTDPDTSHEAAEAVSPVVRELQKKVLAYAKACDAAGFTDRQLEEHFECSGSTYRTRRAELVAKGLIEDTGDRLALGGSGRRHAVWRITATGKAA